MNTLIIDFSYTDWILIILSAILIGASKTGLSGAGMISVAFMANIFGGKMSSGLVLPMLSVADIFAVIYYNRHAQWKYILKLFPWVALGITVGIITGQNISDKTFKHLIAILVIGSLIVMTYRDFKKDNMNVPNYWWFAMIMGLLGGFATMIGNAAGGIMAVYLLSMRLPKNIFIGTGAWYFFIVNLCKIPFHIFIWKSITTTSIVFDLMMIPALAFGAFVGYKLVKLIPEKVYRIFIIVITFISSIFLFVR